MTCQSEIVSNMFAALQGLSISFQYDMALGSGRTSGGRGTRG